MKVKAVLLLVFAAIAGCGSEPEPLTVEEYAATVCPAWNTGIAETWGPAAQVAEDLRKKIDVVPPEPLEEYHQANLAYLDTLVDYAKDQPPSDATDLGAFFNDDERQDTAIRLHEAQEALSPDMRAVLQRHGCIDG